MASIEEQIGAILVSLARARQIADLNSVAIAEQYKQNPLLEGLSVPRVRIPEMVIEMPLLVEQLEEAVPNKLNDADSIVKEILPEVDNTAKDAKVTLTNDVRNRITSALKVGLNAVPRPSSTSGATYVPKETVMKAAEESVIKSLRDTGVYDKLGAANIRKLRATIRKRADEVAEVSSGRPPILKTNINTGDVKDKATAASVTRLRIVLKEEGLEWTAIKQEDGSITRTLTPE